MYAPAYGYGPGSLSAPFNPNGIPPQPHNNPHHHQQPGLQQQQQQQIQQQPLQHLMYNPQQYGGVVSHQSPYGASSPGMGGNAGAMGVMQNNGMAHMPGGHVPTYQTPYSSSPYGGNLPASTASSLPPNFMPTSNTQPFNMNATNINLQHPVQRMQPPPTSSTPQPGQRVPPFAGGQQITPPNASTAQSQFSTPQALNQASLHTSNNNPPGQSGPILTPQTPTFPQGSQGANALSTPLSPGSESREKERVTLLLEINRELLMEVMRMNAHNAHSEVKKDESAVTSPDGSEKEKGEKEKAQTTKPPASREYFECMRRLQSNLAYLAAIADRSHKPSSQIPAHPAIMSAPPFQPKSSQPPSATSSSPTAESKKEESDDQKPLDSVSEEERSETLKEQYKKLQALFPGVDPKKEPTANQAARAQAQAAAMQAQKQAGAAGVDINAQQKLQNDLLRQKMMQAQQQQQQMVQASQLQQQNR